MKKKLLFIILLFTVLINAQERPKPGIKTGLNITNITNTNYDFKQDFYVGGFLTLPFSNFYILQPELIYSRQGAKLRFNGSSSSKIEIDYFSLAIANKFLIFKKSNFYAVIGTFIDFKINDNLESSWEDIFFIIFNWDIGIFMGLEYELSQNFGVEFRYKRGFADLPKIDQTYQDGKQSNTVYQIGLKYKFGH